MYLVCAKFDPLLLNNGAAVKSLLLSDKAVLKNLLVNDKPVLKSLLLLMRLHRNNPGTRA
jgi:hypothetical protein